MRVGTICYATSRGLGHLAHDFFTHGVIDDVMVVRHSSIPTNEHWYPGAPETELREFDLEKAKRFCSGHDAMIFFETPFNWNLFEWCKTRKIRTYLVTMYECTPINHPEPHRYLCPSLLDLEYFPSGVFLPLPVEVKWNLREKAEVFIHNGGYLGIRYREGTDKLIEAMQYVRSDLQLVIRVQENVSQQLQDMARNDRRIIYRPETIPYDALYASGDVAVGAQKWNGCSLPLQEAFAAGLCVMNTDRFPMNKWLPQAPLIKPSTYKEGSCIGGSYLRFREAVVTPQAIAAKMDEWYGRDITELSLLGKAWAEANSWSVLKDRWVEELKR